MADSETGPPFDLREAGRELLGERWQPVLADILGVNVRTVLRWANGQNAIPPPMIERVEALLAIARASRADAAQERERRASDLANRQAGPVSRSDL